MPFESFVNTIEDYPYPYVIGRLCWEFPCATPSDWQAQHLHKPNNPKTVEDWKALLDATVIKQGVMNLVFHPHGWIKPEQVVELIDHAETKHGKKVKFLNVPRGAGAAQQEPLGRPDRARDRRAVTTACACSISTATGIRTSSSATISEEDAHLVTPEGRMVRRRFPYFAGECRCSIRAHCGQAGVFDNQRRLAIH